MKISKKIIISILLVFIVINICFLSKQFYADAMVSQVINKMNSSNTTYNAPAFVTNITHFLIAVAQVGLTGYFIIRFTLEGIRYFTVVAVIEDPSAQAESKNRLVWIFLYGLLAFGVTSFIRIIYDWIA
jgi:hypothetical protein